jgi:ubiquinone/menaquinone biosynthesis C-methylase UbiE
MEHSPILASNEKKLQSTGSRCLRLPGYNALMERFYRGFYDEGSRLDVGGSADVERARTLDILARHLPASPAVVLDVGGGTGVYALPLADQGYAVHLIDAMAHHIEYARRADAQGRLASCNVGDARALAFRDGTADAVLLLGPLYHLVERVERLRALREAQRVLRAGGVLFAAAVSRFAGLIDGIERDFVADPVYQAIVTRDLEDGVHNAVGEPQYFPHTFFHHPNELRNEVSESGFEVRAVAGIEGPIWSSRRIPGWADPEQRAVILDLLRRVESEPTLLGASSHLMAIAHKTAP